jgi:hypothetical protein
MLWHDMSKCISSNSNFIYDVCRQENTYYMYALKEQSTDYVSSIREQSIHLPKGCRVVFGRTRLTLRNYPVTGATHDTQSIHHTQQTASTCQRSSNLHTNDKTNYVCGWDITSAGEFHWSSTLVPLWLITRLSNSNAPLAIRQRQNRNTLARNSNQNQLVVRGCFQLIVMH